MLFIIEIFFLVTGLWAIFSGKLPVGLFRLLFGRGEYELPPTQSRLFGALLASPLPLAFLVSFILTTLLGARGINIGIGFEVFYLMGVIFASIVIARRARRPEALPSSDLPSANPEQPATSGRYEKRLLYFFGIGSLMCITTISFTTFVTVIFSTFTFGGRVTGDFWQDVFPFILMVAIMGFGLFGIYKLFRAMRKL